MSEKFDNMKQIRLSPENEKALLKTKEQMPIKVTLGALANRAIELGLPELLSPTKPQGKKGR